MRSLIADALNPETLHEMIEGRLLAIRVPILQPDSCAELASRLLQEARAPYTHVLYRDEKPRYFHYGVDRIGTPFNSTYAHPIGSGVFETYHRDAVDHMERMEKLCAPIGGNPILGLIGKLDRLHPRGAEIASLHGRPMFAGIVRVMEPHLEGSERLEEQPHFDSLPPHFYPMTAQLSANIYLALPDGGGEGGAEGDPGGELEVWDVPPLSSREIESAAPDTDWRAKLPPSHRLKPRLGELIIINTRRPHAVRRLHRGVRMSLQTFIGAQPDSKLRCWN